MDRPDVGSRIRIRIRIGTATGQGQGRRKACKAVGAAYLLRGTTLEKEEEEAGADSTSMAAALEVAAAAVVVVTIQQADRRPDQVSSAWNSAVSLSLPRCSVFVSRPQSFRVLCLPVAASRRRRNALAKGYAGSSSSFRPPVANQQETVGG